MQIVTHNELETQENKDNLRRVKYNLQESVKQKNAAKQKEATTQEASLTTNDAQQGNTKPSMEPQHNPEQEYNSLIKDLDRLCTLKQNFTVESEAQQRQVEKMKCCIDQGKN